MRNARLANPSIPPSFIPLSPLPPLKPSHSCLSLPFILSFFCFPSAPLLSSTCLRSWTLTLPNRKTFDFFFFFNLSSLFLLLRSPFWSEVKVQAIFCTRQPLFGNPQHALTAPVRRTFWRLPLIFKPKQQHWHCWRTFFCQILSITVQCPPRMGIVARFHWSMILPLGNKRWYSFRQVSQIIFFFSRSSQNLSHTFVFRKNCGVFLSCDSSGFSLYFIKDMQFCFVDDQHKDNILKCKRAESQKINHISDK